MWSRHCLRLCYVRESCSLAADPELTAETRAWLTKSTNDLRAAEALFDSSPSLLDEAVFHCQQAAEKALKGFLTWHGRPFRKTHNLEEIGEECLVLDPTLMEIVDLDALRSASTHGDFAIPVLRK